MGLILNYFIYFFGILFFVKVFKTVKFKWPKQPIISLNDIKRIKKYNEDENDSSESLLNRIKHELYEMKSFIDKHRNSKEK